MKKIISLVLGGCLISGACSASYDSSLKLGFEAGLVMAYIFEVIPEAATVDGPVVSMPCSEITPFPAREEDVDCSRLVNEFNGQVTCDEIKEIIKRVAGMKCIVGQTDDAITVTLPDISEDLNKLLPVFTVNQKAVTYDNGVFTFDLSKVEEF